MSVAETTEWWLEFRPEEFAEKGINPMVVEAVGIIATNRATHPDETGAVVVKKPFLNGPTDTIPTPEHPHYETLIREVFEGSSVLDIVTHILRPYEGEGVTKDYIEVHAKRASDILAFNKRLEAKPDTPVLFIDSGLNNVSFFVKGGHSTGEPVRLTRVDSTHQKDAKFWEFQVPTDGFVQGTMPSFSENPAELEDRDGLMSEYPWAITRYLSSSEQVGTELNTSTSWSLIGNNQLWVVGEDTIKELARQWAIQDEDTWTHQAWGPHTRLRNVVKHPLLLMKSVADKIDLDLEEDPQVKALFDDWRSLATEWANGNQQAVEPNTEALEKLMTFNDEKIERGNPEYDVRPKFINSIERALGMPKTEFVALHKRKVIPKRPVKQRGAVEADLPQQVTENERHVGFLRRLVRKGIGR